MYFFLRFFFLCIFFNCIMCIRFLFLVIYWKDSIRGYARDPLKILLPTRHTSCYFETGLSCASLWERINRTNHRMLLDPAPMGIVHHARTIHYWTVSRISAKLFPPIWLVLSRFLGSLSGCIWPLGGRLPFWWSVLGILSSMVLTLRLNELS